MNWNEEIASAPVVTDGAWGTELQLRGLPAGQCPDLWNLSNPGPVESVARAYVEAGSRVILTNTFRSNRIALGESGAADQVTAINRAGVQISRAATAGRALVFASIGPIGKLVSMGDISEAEAFAAFEEQAAALAAAGADALVVETLSDLAEASLALSAAKATGLPVIVSFAFDTGKSKDRTMTGATPEQVAARMTAEGASAIGANCGVGIAESIAICRRLRAATSLPLWIKPNAGLPVMEDGRVVYRTRPEEFAAFLPELLTAGATFTGGCCGTNPEFIHAMAQRMAEQCG